MIVDVIEDYSLIVISEKKKNKSDTFLERTKNYQEILSHSPCMPSKSKGGTIFLFLI